VEKGRKSIPAHVILNIYLSYTGFSQLDSYAQWNALNLSSALLGMLPPPKRKLPASKTSGSSLTVNKSMAVPKVATVKPAANLPAPPGHLDDDSDDEEEHKMVPAAIRRKEKGKAPSFDLFGLGKPPMICQVKAELIL
jgi:hypothetical protein